MFPELIRIGPITLKTYGFFVAVAFLVGMNYAKQRAKNTSIAVEVILDLSLWILVSGLVGARLLYVVLNWEFYKSRLLEVFYIWSGGLVFYGGVLFGFTVGVLYAIKKKLKPWLLADILAPGIFLGVAIARIGCFSAGCCYGKPTDLPWGIRFTNPASLVPESALGLKLHPTQIYESIFCFLLFVGLHFLSTSNRKKFDGEIFLISMITYSIWRFFIEFLRWDDRGAKIF
ncbi:MAG: prolipoprotein diacylglyceryl transferase, partial [Elusimicrobiota bacterium]|nr:prolipoprotein diacylglyceryl transferase [Elusimicrobiota bacterium]